MRKYWSLYAVTAPSKLTPINVPSILTKQNISRCIVGELVMHRSFLPATVGAQNVVPLGEEAASHQWHRALHAGETLAVPLTLLKWDIFGTCQTWKRKTGNMYVSVCFILVFAQHQAYFNHMAEIFRVKSSNTFTCGINSLLFFALFYVMRNSTGKKLQIECTHFFLLNFTVFISLTCPVKLHLQHTVHLLFINNWPLELLRLDRSFFLWKTVGCNYTGLFPCIDLIFNHR